MEELPLEGWYTDPYARHEARWLSEGTPTALVRDGDVEGHDPVADEPFEVAPIRIEGSPRQAGSDLQRADEAQDEEPFDPSEASRAGAEGVDQA